MKTNGHDCVSVKLYLQRRVPLFVKQTKKTDRLDPKAILNHYPM